MKKRNTVSMLTRNVYCMAVPKPKCRNWHIIYRQDPEVLLAAPLLNRTTELVVKDSLTAEKVTN